MVETTGLFRLPGCFHFQVSELAGHDRFQLGIPHQLVDPFSVQVLQILQATGATCIDNGPAHLQVTRV